MYCIACFTHVNACLLMFMHVYASLCMKTKTMILHVYALFCMVYVCLRMFAHGLRMSVHDSRLFTHENQNEHFECLHTVISVMHGLHMFRYGQPSRKSWLLEEKGSR
jgi:hypothetical protein